MPPKARRPGRCIDVVYACVSNYAYDLGLELVYTSRAIMIVEYIRYTVETARAAAFIDAYGAAASSLKESPHCLAYELTRCVEAPDSFILRIEWDSSDGHLNGFRKSTQFKEFFRHVQPFLKDIAEMRHYASTGLEWSRSAQDT